MNTDLKQIKIGLASSPALLLTRGMVDSQEMENAVSFSLSPSLDEVLDQIGPLPKKSLFFGQADDELPVLLDLSNPLPGPVLIAGDPGAGKTNLLRIIARFVVSTHRPQEIQYGVITSCPHEWEDLSDVPHCIGIFPVNEESSVNFTQALALWVSRSKMNGQAVLFMIDGLDQFACQNHAVDDLHKILLHGPSRQIWPILTINPNQSEDARAWLKYFRTWVFGFTRQVDAIDDSEDRSMNFESLSKGTEFTLKENAHWRKFRIPRS
jgi:hypothetical protein